MCQKRQGKISFAGKALCGSNRADGPLSFPQRVSKSGPFSFPQRVSKWDFNTLGHERLDRELDLLRTRRDAFGYNLSPWVLFMRSEARNLGVPFILVEFPMPRNYREKIVQSSDGQSFRNWLNLSFNNESECHLDFSLETSIDDSKFEDDLHLSPEGAQIFSQLLGKELTNCGALKSRL